MRVVGRPAMCKKKPESRRAQIVERTSAAGDERVLLQIKFFFRLSVCAMRMTGKKAHEVKFSIPLAFCTHSMLHNFSFIYFMHGYLRSLLRSAKQKKKRKRDWKSPEQHKFLFSCCTGIHAFSQRQSMMNFFFCVVVDHVRVCYHSTSMPYTLGSTVFCLCFSSLSMQVMNFKLKGGSKLLTHVCMQISVCQESARCCICEQIRFGSHKERERQ